MQSLGHGQHDNERKEVRLVSRDQCSTRLRLYLNILKPFFILQRLSVPWGQVLRSKPFMAILIAHFCSNFGWYMLLIELPTFMNQILKFDMSSVGIVGPNMVQIFNQLHNQIFFIRRMLDSLLCHSYVCGFSPWCLAKY